MSNLRLFQAALLNRVEIYLDQIEREERKDFVNTIIPNALMPLRHNAEEASQSSEFVKQKFIGLYERLGAIYRCHGTINPGKEGQMFDRIRELFSGEVGFDYNLITMDGMPKDVRGAPIPVPEEPK